MSTIFMAILIIAFTVILPWILINRHKKAQQKKERAHFHRFSNAGSERHLSFSRQEIIQNKIIGFDGIQQVLMIIEMEHDYDVTCIAIKDLVKCSITKVYHTVGENQDKEKICKEINLVFIFSDDRTPVPVLFYNNDTNSVYLMAEMEAKAKEWQTSISRMIPRPVVMK